MGKMTINKKFMIFLALGVLLCAAHMGGAGITAQALSHDFAIDASLMPSTGDTYDVSLTVGNAGNDWEGTVRLLVGSQYSIKGAAAYDTMLALPQGSTKQFVVKVPSGSVESTETMVKVLLLDKKSKVIEEAEFKRLLREGEDAVPMGILSDEYSALTYLDMGGEEISYYKENYPIRLVEMNQDNLADSLASLSILVIDDYNTGILPEETLNAIEEWVYNGGVLIIGTGSHVEATLGGFDYLNIQCDNVYNPGEYEAESGMDWVKELPIAEFTDMKAPHYSNYSYSAYGSLALTVSQGSGSVGVLPYALIDFGRLDANAYLNVRQEYFVRNLLDEVSSKAASRYWTKGTYSANIRSYNARRIFRYLGNGDNRLNLGILKVLVVLYVIFVGPVLYLILRFTKKREIYWMAVPVTALMGILMVFFAGRGFEVVGTRVYSVTVSDLSNQKNAQAYLRCYDASHKEWDLRLAEGYDSIGPVANLSYRYSDFDTYYYHVRKEGERLFFGINPNTGFEDSYFMTGSAAARESGSLELSDLKTVGSYMPTGIISNGTGRDFPYVAVVTDDRLFVYKNLRAGVSCRLSDLEIIYDGNQYYSVVDAYVYDIMDEANQYNPNDVDILAALGLGICQAYPQDDANVTLVIGVTKNWDKVVDDSCKEISYGCLYMVQ